MLRKGFGLMMMGTVIFFLGSFSSADVPHMINYQGKLTTASGGCLNDTVQMTFTIYADSFGTSVDWTETQDDVVVKEGVFSVLLGSADSIPASVFDGSIKYLGVQVESDPEMRPLKPMVSVGYALRSEFTDTAEYARSAPPDDDWDTDTSGFYIYRMTGNVGIGAFPQHKLDVAGTAQMTGFKMPTGASNGYVLTSDAGGVGTWQVAQGGFGGSGTANYVPKFLDATTLGNSNIYEDGVTGDNVGIGTTDPGWSRLKVTNRGTVNIQGINVQIAPLNETSDIDFGLNVDATSTNVTGTSTTWGGLLSVVANGAQDDLGLMHLIYNGGSSTAFYVRGDGNVGIGTSNPQARLHIHQGSPPPWQLRLTSSASGATDGDGMYIGITGSDARFWLWEAWPLRFATSGSERVRIDQNGNVGIGTTSPTEELHVIGDIYCTGKLTSDGGNDPPYVLYNKETRNAVVERVAKEVPAEKLDGAVLFWNGDDSRFEVYLPAKGEFRDLLGNLLATVSDLKAAR